VKRKFKQWWSPIQQTSTKRTITSHLNWTHWTHKENHDYDAGSSGPGLGQAQKYGVIKKLS